jgi:hypothetical protein
MKTANGSTQMIDNNMQIHFVKLQEAESLRDMAIEFMVNGETEEFFAIQTEYATAMKQRLQMETI